MATGIGKDDENGWGSAAMEFRSIGEAMWWQEVLLAAAPGAARSDSPQRIADWAVYQLRKRMPTVEPPTWRDPLLTIPRTE